MRAILFGLVLFGSGCMFQNISSEEHLQDVVARMNEDTRWGHVDQAAAHVGPRYMRSFLARRAGWGHSLEISDIELSNMRVRDDRASATAVITVAWYSYSTAELYRTKVRQEWRKDNDANEFFLVSEHVIQGNAGVLEEHEESEAGAI